MDAKESANKTRLVAALQGMYFLLTGLWPLIHLRSFLAVTGLKYDIWQVETVGALVTATGAGLVLAAARARVSAEIAVIAIGSAAGLAVIDTIYVLRGRISAIYLVDVILELVIIVAWIVGLWRDRAANKRRAEGDSGSVL